MKQPVLTVVVTSYNYSKYISKCIESVLSQDFDDFELIIFDNNSTDGTVEALSCYLSDERVRLVRHEVNIGAFSNLSAALRVGVGRYLSMVSADDCLLPGHFKRLISSLENSPGCALAYAPIMLMDSSGALHGLQNHSGYSASSYQGGRNEFVDLLVHDCYVTLCSVIFDREHLRRDLYFDIESWGGADWELFVRLALRYKDFAFVSTPGSCYRIHDLQYSRTNFYSTLEPLYTHIYIVEKYMEEILRQGPAAVYLISKHLRSRILQYSDSDISHVRHRLDCLLRRLDGELGNDLGQQGDSLCVVAVGGADFGAGCEEVRELANALSASFVTAISLQDAAAVNQCIRSSSCEFVLLANSSVAITQQEVREAQGRLRSKQDFAAICFNGRAAAAAAVNPVVSWEDGALAGAVLCRRSVFEKVGGYPASLIFNEGVWDFIVRLLRDGCEIQTQGVLPAGSTGGSNDELAWASIVFRNTSYFLPGDIVHAASLLLDGAKKWHSKVAKVLEYDPSCGSAHFLNLLAKGRVNAESDEALFTVILTTYNRPYLLQDSLNSLAAQLFKNFEVILINDNGDPVEYLLAAYDFPITYIRQGRNQGLSTARNVGLKLAKGRYIVYLDDDDLYLPSHFSLLAQALKETPEAMLYTRAWYVKERLEDGQRVELDRQPAYLHETFSLERLLVSNYIPVNTWCVPRSAFDRAGVFDADLPALEDWELLLRLAKACPLRHLAVPSVEVRIRDTVGDHMSQRQRSNFPALFREIYGRNPSEHSQVQRERALFLDALDKELAGSVSATNDVVAQWLQKRRFSAVQKRLTADHVSRKPLPVVGLVIIHTEGDEALLARTLASLPDRSCPGLVTEVGLISTVASSPAAAVCAQVARIDVPAAVPAAITRLAGSLAADWLLLVYAGDEVVADGLLVAALELAQGALCTAVYADQLFRKPDGSLGAALFPDFNLDMLLSLPGTMARRWLYRRDTLLAKGGFENRFGRAFELDYILRQIEADGIGSVGHISEPLLKVDAPRMADEPDERGAITAHLERRGYPDARVSAVQPGRYRIDYAHAERPLVSIIIPTKDQLPMLQRCVETLLERTAYQHYEVLIVDNNSEEDDAREWLTAIEGLDDPKLRVLRFPHPFNYSAMNNLAAAQARGEYLLLLNNDTATLKEDWLEQLLNHAQRPEVGIVGAKLLYPDGCIQHAGVLLGLRGPAEHPFIGEPMGASGYLQRLEIDQNYSAVTAACLMVRKSIYAAVGGMDEEAFKVSYNDVDLCLKVGASGHLVVWTPHAVVLHEGSVSQRNVDTASVEHKRKRFAAEQDALYEKWLPLIARDPAYNRNLSLSGKGFELEVDTELNWRPLVWHPLPVVLAHPADPWGCGNYRVIKPFEALRDAGLIEGMLSEGLLQVVDLERYDPDVVLLQRQIGDERLEAMRRIKQFSRAFKVYELDDYLPNLPLKNVHRSQMPKDIVRSLRKGLSYVDRFIVSTEPLAEALTGMHADIVVLQNRLPVGWWKGLKSQRGVGPRPRVGWAGGVGHGGDLELIADVVRELASEVDWVFFGMCPDRIRPYVKEVHPGVEIDRYPAALARLNLDLALAPLEQNLFNDCKSNLRLLEYGACGFPVVCSDTRAYRGDLPVTRVKNRFKDWVDAIRMHLSDPDASAAMGDSLRERITTEWMLEGGNLDEWRAAWTSR